MQSKGPTPSRAKRVTFDVRARSFCVHIITRWWRFAWLYEYVCLLKTCRTFFSEKRSLTFFVCAVVSHCARCDVSVWHNLRRPKSLPFTPLDGVLAWLSASRKEGWKEYRFAYFLFVVNIDRVFECVFWCGYGFFVESFSNCLSLFRFLTSS